MAEKVVSVRLQARVEGFTAGMRKARASVDDLTKADVPKAAKGYSDLANKAALAGAAVAVGLGVAVKRFAEFDAAMSAVRANTGGTAKEMKALTDAAIRLGADSQFTATEAAQGINELAKAGVAAADILGGGLKGSLDLAAAGQIGVAEAAETTATALTQFKLGGDKAVHVADLLANGANKAQGGVSDLAAALKQGGLVASATGLSIEETTAGLTAFASAGLIGSDAGTSFKTMLQRLSAPVGEAKVAMDELGISAYDNQGNFVGLADVAGQLQRSMEDLTPAQRNAALATIFGSDAVRAANVLYEQGAEGIANWTAEVSAQGAASKQAAALTDNLKGDIERLGGAFDTVLIGTGSGANDALRTLTQSLEGLLTNVAKIPAPVLLAGAGLAAMVLTVPKGIKVFREFGATADSVGLSFDKISAKGPRAAKAVNAVTGSAKAFGGAMAVLAAAGAVDGIFGTDSSRPGTDVLIKDFTTAGDTVDAFSARLRKFSEESSNWFTADDVRSFGDALKYTFDPGVSDQIDHAVGSFAGFFGITDKSRITSSTNALNDLDTALVGLVSSGNIDGASRTFDDFAGAAAAQGVSVDELKGKLPGYVNALAGVDNAAKDAAGTSGELAGATEDLAAQAVTAEDALKALQDQIDGLGAPFAKQRAAARAFDDSVRAAADAVEQYGAKGDQTKEQIKQFGKITLTASGDIDTATEAGSALSASFDAIAESTLANVNATIEAAGGVDNLAASTKAGTAAMKDGRDAFLAAAKAAGIGKDEAKALADKLGLIPKNVKIAVSQSGAEAASAAIDEAARDRTTTIFVKRRIADFKAAQENAANEKKVATGGAIFGPGTGTSDSIPAWLSNGEHVWTAAEVAKLGGQSAMYALRAAVRGGRAPGFAAGGAVQYAPAMAYAGPTSYSTRNDYGLTADQVTIVTNDPNSFRREIRTAPYRAKGRPGR